MYLVSFSHIPLIPVFMTMESEKFKSLELYFLGVCRVPIFCRVPSAEYYDCVKSSPSFEPSICIF